MFLLCDGLLLAARPTAPLMTQLYFQVFDTGRSLLWIFYSVGYGLPSVIVLLSVLIVETSGTHGYGSEKR